MGAIRVTMLAIAVLKLAAPDIAPLLLASSSCSSFLKTSLVKLLYIERKFGFNKLASLEAMLVLKLTNY